MSTPATAANESELDRLRRENEELKKKQAAQSQGKALTFKVSEKGGVSVYGLGRFPVTLYKEQWVKLLDVAGDLMDFIQANDAQLKTKE